MLAVALTSTQARAEPCAENARGVLEQHRSYIVYCPECGDMAPGEPRSARDVHVEATEQGAHVLVVDGHALPLAQGYVQVSDARYDNLAVLSGCSEVGVAPALRVTPETEQGVMITPTWVAATSPPRPAPTAPPPTAFARDSADDDDMPSLLLLAVASAGCGAGVTATCALAMRRRRRRTGLPRALDLTDRLDRGT
jgi:hypothetical protein